MRFIRLFLSAAAGLFAMHAASFGQQFPSGAGRFTNFETPQTHPIEVATVGGTDYVFVCNTPDDSIEIYQCTSTSPYLTFKSSIRVGLGPTSVRFMSGRLYSCNLDGDSVSVVRLTGGTASVTSPILERTVAVGDEPADIAFQGNVAAVSLSTRNRLAGFLFPGMTPISPAELLLEASSSDSLPYAVKTPRQVAWVGDYIYTANLRGGSPDSRLSPQYDLAIHQYDTVNETMDFVGGLGTTHHAFAMNSAGSLMFVVGLKAMNQAAFGLENVADLETGFVQSWLWVVDIDGSGAMTVRPEAEPNENSDLESINLNRDYTEEALTALDPEDALAQPTGIVLVQDGSEIETIAITAFSSDKVAFLTPSSTTPGGYDIQRVDIPTQSSGSYSTAGPRGIAYSSATGFFYTNGRLDNSLHVIDPSAGTPVKTSIALQNDPTPLVIREGREFLYSAAFSGSQMVGCFCCHVDGTTDSLAWDLSEDEAGPDIEPEFHDGDMDVDQVPAVYKQPSGPGHYTEFPANKGRMVTQSLQGLINYPLNEEMQFASTNAPYYWRGVRRGPDDAGDPFLELTEAFDSFNEAFVKLQGMPDIDTGAGIRGISEEDMRKFRLFVNTIFYPPNPEQPQDRIVPGSLPEDPEDVNDLTPTLAEGFGGSLWGMEVFFNLPMVSTVGPDTTFTTTCIDCHAPPSGSSHTATLLFAAIDGSTLTATEDHPFESAALRGLVPREMWLHDDFTDDGTHIVSNTALLHPGTPDFQIDKDFAPTAGAALVTSINTFLFNFFPVSGFAIPLVKFTREFDTGIAPAVGRSYTVGTNSTANNDEFEFLETQVERGNIGLAVFERKSGTKKGYWYDPTTGLYVEEGTSNTQTRSNLFTNATTSGNAVIAQATPLGADRRWASSSGVATLLTGSDPSDIELQGMVPNTAWVDAVRFNLGLHLGASPDIDVLSSTDPLILGTTAWALRTLQNAVLGQFGVPSSPRHEPPRRFRVTGTNIRPGARLILESPNEDPIEMDLYPVMADGPDMDSDLDDVVWETFQEMEALHVFALLNGGFRDGEVVDVLLRRADGSGLDPSMNNVYTITVVNEDDTDVTATSQVLTIHDDRETY